MQGSTPSKPTTDLGNLRRKIKSGVTRGFNPRPFTDMELQKFKKEEQELIELIEAQRNKRISEGRKRKYEEGHEEATRKKLDSEEVKRNGSIRSWQATTSNSNRIRKQLVTCLC